MTSPPKRRVRTAVCQLPNGRFQLVGTFDTFSIEYWHRYLCVVERPAMRVFPGPPAAEDSVARHHAFRIVPVPCWPHAALLVSEGDPVHILPGWTPVPKGASPCP